jgi:bifunctional non-homologous end joining protein LigD
MIGPNYPAIAAKLRAKSFTLDGEAVVTGTDGVAVFHALHRRHKSRGRNAVRVRPSEAQRQGSSIVAARRAQGEAGAAAGAGAGRHCVQEHTDEDGAVVFRHACKMGLEGIVSKRLGAPYRSGPSRDWLRVKNPDSPAMRRAREHFARVEQ